MPPTATARVLSAEAGRSSGGPGAGVGRQAVDTSVGTRPTSDDARPGSAGSPPVRAGALPTSAGSQPASADPRTAGPRTTADPRTPDVRTADLRSTPGAVLPAPVRPRAEALGPEETVELLDRVKGGDSQALDRLLERCIPALTRWARGRLPDVARGMLDTGDLVQETVMSALRRLDVFEARHQGALQAYLRQALTNRIRDAIRQRMRRPQAELPDEVLDEQTSPLERLIGAEHLAIYDAALQRLRPADREALVGRMEMQYSYEQLAIALGKPSPNAARVAVTRAIKRLVEEIRRER